MILEGEQSAERADPTAPDARDDSKTTSQSLGVCRPVIYTSYPKTGSSLLFTLVARYRDLKPAEQVTRRVFAQAKNNFLIEHGEAKQPTFLLKTHLLPGHYIDRVRKDPASTEVGPLPEGKDVWPWLAGSGGGAIYGIRNPFSQFFSAVDYSRLLYVQSFHANSWAKDGRAEAYFRHLLGLPAIPTPEEFANFDVRADGPTVLEERLWRFVNGRGTLPIFEGGSSPTYFDHVNHCFPRVALQPRHLIVTYERLMAADPLLLAGLAGLLDISLETLTAAFRAEAEERATKSGRYVNNPFFAGFRVSTPEVVRQLPSWTRLREACLTLCPPLQMVLGEG
jgi:hypothetical protein